MANAARRVLGIDPGLAATGYGLVEGDASSPVAVAFGVIRTKASRSRAERLAAILDAVGALIDEHAPSELAIEQQYVASNVRSAMAIGEARAAAMIAAAQRALPVFEFQPSTIKEAVAGHGGAPKEQVQAMIATQLRLAAPPEPFDAADALAVALTRLADLRLEALLARGR
jgi:crossover junction endodeoxyribonuclease RuvC